MFARYICSSARVGVIEGVYTYMRVCVCVCVCVCAYVCVRVSVMDQEEGLREIQKGQKMIVMVSGAP